MVAAGLEPNAGGGVMVCWPSAARAEEGNCWASLDDRLEDMS